MRLLIVEDDAMLADGLARTLRRTGHTVDCVTSAEHALLALEHDAFDVILLDVGLPGSDGFDLLARLRRSGNTVPVIVITAREALGDRVRGLDLGADDYLVKPFEHEELEARVRALIRRRATPVTPQLAFGRLTLDLVAREARVDGERVELTPREWAIMELFVTQPGVALAKERMVQSLSSWDDALSANAVEVYVSRLRAKFEPAGLRIRTVRGYGYMLEAEHAR
jgi:two-component system, OmpR family, response regulator